MDCDGRFIPDAKWAISELVYPTIGIALLFPICEVRYLSLNDPYRDILIELERGGLNRNLFMVACDGTLVWRIPEYAKEADYIARIDADDDKFLRATSFQGRILRVAIQTGESILVNRTKN